MTNPTDPNERARDLLADALNKNGVPKEVILLPTTKVLMQAATDAIVCALSHAEDLQRTVTELCAENAQLKMEAHKRTTAVEGYVTVPKALTTDMLEAGEQELAMGNDFADAWEAAIDTMLGVPSFTSPPAPAAAAGGDAEEDAYVIDALAHLLAEISIIVNGPEPAGTKWSYHDLPEKVRALKTAPAAVPAGEAVAWLASDGEVFTDKESADRHSKVWGVNPLLTPLYTTPPAPVQAAPQPADGEAVASVGSEQG